MINIALFRIGLVESYPEAFSLFRAARNSDKTRRALATYPAQPRYLHFAKRHTRLNVLRQKARPSARDDDQDLHTKLCTVSRDARGIKITHFLRDKNRLPDRNGKLSMPSRLANTT